MSSQKRKSAAEPATRALRSNSPARRPRQSAEALAVREALIDPDVAARALHGGDARILRSRAVKKPE